jgi:hypothetical protein
LNRNLHFRCSSWSQVIDLERDPRFN